MIWLRISFSFFSFSSSRMVFCLHPNPKKMRKSSVINIWHTAFRLYTHIRSWILRPIQWYLSSSVCKTHPNPPLPKKKKKKRKEKEDTLNISIYYTPSLIELCTPLLTDHSCKGFYPGKFFQHKRLLSYRVKWHAGFSSNCKSLKMAWFIYSGPLRMEL